jgi:hypothetical protein
VSERRDIATYDTRERRHSWIRSSRCRRVWLVAACGRGGARKMWMASANVSIDDVWHEGTVAAR